MSAMPRSLAPNTLTKLVAPEFNAYMVHFKALEDLAIADGYSVVDRVTAFRKLYYDSAQGARQYAGAIIGGGVWNVLIPGAASIVQPPSWGSAQTDRDYLNQRQVLSIGGPKVDIGHVLAGADAADHPTAIKLAGGLVQMRSNVEATTYVGDLGSVVTEYIHASTASFLDTARNLQSQLLDTTYDQFASPEDMAGDADASAMIFTPSTSLYDTISAYYRQGAGAVRRYSTQANQIGLGALSGNRFVGDTSTWRAAMTGEVFNAALAYAAGKGWKGDVVNVLQNPGPGIVAPTFWEMYFNVSGWVIDAFVNRMVSNAGKE